MNILLVDDEPNIRKMMKHMLRSGGFDVLDAASGAEALALSHHQPIDILVTDVVMEGMDGRVLARSLTAAHPGLPVLFISGFPMDIESERDCHNRCAFLPKPFQRNELLRAISELSAN